MTLSMPRVAAIAAVGSAIAVGSARAEFTGAVTIDPFTAAVSLYPGAGTSVSVEIGIRGGLFDTARYAISGYDLDPSSPSQSGLSLVTAPVGGRLITGSWRPEGSVGVYNFHELTYRNANGSSLDLSGLASISYGMLVSPGSHGAIVTITVRSASAGSATAWNSSDYGDYARMYRVDEFVWLNEAGWSDVTSISFTWGWYGLTPDDITREISNLNANFIPSPGAMALLPAAAAPWLRRRR